MNGQPVTFASVIEKIRLVQYANFAARTPYIAFGVAAIAVVLATLIRFGIDPYILPPAPFATYYPAIILVTFICGAWPGIFTVIVSGILGWYLFLPPTYSFELNAQTSNTLALYSLVAATDCAIVALLTAAIARSLAQEKLARILSGDLALELRSANIMREINILCGSRQTEFLRCVGSILDGAIKITRADKGTFQLFNSSTGALEIAIHRGFEKPFLEYFATVRDQTSSCGAALQTNDRIVVDDVTQSQIFEQDSLKAILDAGVRAVQSTPLIGSDGQPLGMISTHFTKPHRVGERELQMLDLMARQAADYLERKQFEQTEKLLTREVQHRANNLLAIIQSIAHRTFSGGHSLDQAREIFEGRLQALARTHHRLTQSNLGLISLKEIVQSELDAFSSRTKVEGIQILLGYQHAQQFSLMIHELATNAVKYGSLSVANGDVRIAWTLTKNAGDNVLKFCWRERKGPKVIVPTRLGFGSTLLKTIFADARLDFAPDGFGCEIETVLREAEETSKVLN